jgi:hypothetical protein
MFQVLQLKDFDDWQRAFHQLPVAWQDVHFRPGYYRVHESRDATAACAVMSDNRGVVLYPFLRCRITDPRVSGGEALYDLQGAPGYNGIASSTENNDCLAEFHHLLSEYCRETKVVAEISRINPALKNERFSTPFMSFRKLNVNVIVDLTATEEELWTRSFSQAARKQVNKARRHGLTTHLAESASDLVAFHQIFAHTMERNGATPEARHPLAYFQALWKECPDGMLFYLTIHQGRPVAAELVTLGSSVGYSFLGGTLNEAFPIAANDILKHDIILDLKRRGLKSYCLGGGQTANDGIHRYKQKFSQAGDVDFYLASRIHDQTAFDQLVARWAAAYPERVESGTRKILSYRF